MFQHNEKLGKCFFHDSRVLMTIYIHDGISWVCETSEEVLIAENGNNFPTLTFSKNTKIKEIKVGDGSYRSFVLG